MTSAPDDVPGVLTDATYGPSQAAVHAVANPAKTMASSARDGPPTQNVVGTLESYGPWLLGTAGLLVAVDLARGLPWTRRLLQEVLRAFVVLDLGVQAAVRRIFPPRYELLGACQRRGACCTQIVAEPPRALLRRPRLLRAFIGLHRVLHNFHVVGRGPQGQLLFRCGFLQPGGRCGIYRFRPRLCRTYPVLPFFAPPKVLPGCGYRIKRRGLSGHAGLPVVDAHVGVLHETPPTRPHDGALEHPEDFVLFVPPAPGHATHPARTQDVLPASRGAPAP